jgi:hypothetical protein
LEKRQFIRDFDQPDRRMRKALFGLLPEFE